jgi:hypothetical protein
MLQRECLRFHRGLLTHNNSANVPSNSSQESNLALWVRRLYFWSSSVQDRKYCRIWCAVLKTIRLKYRRAATAAVTVFLPFLMITGVTAPIIGSTFDHHYADRSPFHSHAFVGNTTNLHVHGHVTGDHNHYSSVTGDAVSISSTSISTSQSLLSLEGSLFGLRVTEFEDVLHLVHLNGVSPRHENIITPLDRPPRIG